MSLPVFFDTCSLVGYDMTDTLLQLAEAGTYRPLWSSDVLAELQRTLVNSRGLPRDSATRRIGAMQEYFPDAEVSGYERLVASMTNDPKDRHVLAAAVRGQAALLVTFNLDDFPASSTAPFDIEVRHPDDFLRDPLDLYPGQTLRVISEQLADLRNPSVSFTELCDRLTRNGVPGFVADLRARREPPP